MNLYEAFASGRERGTERRTKRTLAEYMPAAIGGDTKAQQAIYGVDPEAGYKVQGMARQQREQDYSDLARAADFYAKTGDQQAYAYLQQNAQRLGPQFAGLPTSITTPEDKEGSMKWAQALSETFGGAGGKGVGVQSTYIDAQGNRVAIMRDGSTQVLGKAAPSTQVIQGETGFYTVDKLTGRASPVVTSGAQPPQPEYLAPGEKQGFPVHEVNGMPVRIDPSLDPNVIRSMEQSPDAWAQGNPMQLPPTVAQPPPQQIRPYQAPPTYIDQRKLAIDERKLQLDEQQARQQAEIRARQQQAKEAEARRKQAQAMRVPEIEDVERGLDRLDAALKALDDNMVFDGGPLDARALAMTAEGQDLIATVGAMQNSLTALTRVPGMGSQSDLEAKLASLRFPSLEMNPETNRATFNNLKKLIEDIRAARGLPPRSTGAQRPRQPAAPPPRRPVLPSDAAVQRVRFNPETGEIE